jgi:hypothetical protein
VVDVHPEALGTGSLRLQIRKQVVNDFTRFAVDPLRRNVRLGSMLLKKDFEGVRSAILNSRKTHKGEH